MVLGAGEGRERQDRGKYLINAKDLLRSNCCVNKWACMVGQVARFVKAYQKELATFTRGKLIEPDLLPGEKAVRLRCVKVLRRFTRTCHMQGVRVCCDKDPFQPPPVRSV